MKKVVLTLDVEDWFHLDYFERSDCDEGVSLLDGIDEFVKILASEGINATFFVVGEVGEKIRPVLRELINMGHDVGVHGWTHKKPMDMSLIEFKSDLSRCKDFMESLNGGESIGFRAPCFSLDRERLDIIKNAGFLYDASRIEFSDHPLYGSIDLSGYEKVCRDIYRKDGFFVFETTTKRVFHKNLPISGGGYLRIFPWWVMRRLVKAHLQSENFYSIYLHPFELSHVKLVPFPSNAGFITKFRCQYRRHSVKKKLRNLINLLKAEQYEFTTFRSLVVENASRS